MIIQSHYAICVTVGGVASIRVLLSPRGRRSHGRSSGQRREPSTKRSQHNNLIWVRSTTHHNRNQGASRGLVECRSALDLAERKRVGMGGR